MKEKKEKNNFLEIELKNFLYVAFLIKKQSRNVN